MKMAVSTRQMLITFVPSLSMLVAIVIVSVFFQISMPVLTNDVTALAEIHPLSGILSSLGILLWCGTASICFFAAMALRNNKQRSTFCFLLTSAFLSTYLMLDDAFLFHEKLASHYLGINEKVMLAVLGIAVFVYLITFRQFILKTNYGVLLLALGFLATSVTIDEILKPWLWRLGHWEYFFEDGAKWLGIASWCSYYVHTSHLLLVKTYGSPNKASKDVLKATNIFPSPPYAHSLTNIYNDNRKQTVMSPEFMEYLEFNSENREIIDTQGDTESDDN